MYACITCQSGKSKLKRVYFIPTFDKGYIRGYLHHQKQRLVLSKVNPFPPISKVRLYREKYNESLMTEYMEKEYPPIPEEIQMLIEQEE